MAESGIRESSVFGGVEPAELAEVLGDGFAVWMDTDERDAEPLVCQAATVARAPVEAVFDAAVDFERRHEYMRSSRKCKVRPGAGDDRKEVLLRSRMGWSFLSTGFDVALRCELERPAAVRAEYVKGPFRWLNFDMSFHPLAGERTLFVHSFIADVASLGWFTRFFIKHMPEFEFPMHCGFPIVPLQAIVDEAERRSGKGAGGPAAPPPALHEFLEKGRLAPAVEHGYLTVCRTDENRRTVDVTGAARIGAPRPEVWDVAHDPERLAPLFQMLTSGRMTGKSEEFLQMELRAGVRFALFGRKYIIKGKARYEPPAWFDCVEADIEGDPVEWGSRLIEAGGETIFCHKFYRDPKRDWLPRKFLGSHPELEQAMIVMPPFIWLRAFRKRFGPPKASSSVRSAP